MIQRVALFAVVALLAFSAAGCFDFEAEVKVLPDGSGFVTVWVQLPTRIATIAAAAEGLTLARQKRSILARLDKIFYERPGVKLVERVTLTEAGNEILRYRYAFDDVASLNAFWSQPENREQDVTLQGGTLALQTAGEGCGARFDVKLALPAIPLEDLNRLADNVLGVQAPEARASLIEEYYKGRFRLRVVLPGQVVATDADKTDTGGHPLWDRTLFDLYRRGLAANVSTHVVCGPDTPRAPAPDETPPLPTVALSEGPKPAIGDVVAALANLGDLVTLEIDAEVDKKSKLTIVYRIDPRVDQPVENLLLTVLATVPTLARDWESSTGRDEQGRRLITLRTKDALRLDKTGSGTLFAGRDGRQVTFRLKLPALAAGGTAVPEAVGPVLVRLHVKMPREIERTNATMVEGTTATWALTARDLREPVVLEAICPR